MIMEVIIIVITTAATITTSKIRIGEETRQTDRHVDESPLKKLRLKPRNGFIHAQLAQPL